MAEVQGCIAKLAKQEKEQAAQSLREDRRSLYVVKKEHLEHLR